MSRVSDMYITWDIVSVLSTCYTWCYLEGGIVMIALSDVNSGETASLARNIIIVLQSINLLCYHTHSINTVTLHIYCGMTIVQKHLKILLFFGCKRINDPSPWLSDALYILKAFHFNDEEVLITSSHSYVATYDVKFKFCSQ